MEKSRFSKSQIIFILNKQEQGLKIRWHQSRAWHQRCDLLQREIKYGGLSVSELARIKELETENIRLKRMYADLSLVHHALKDAVEKRGKL